MDKKQGTFSIFLKAAFFMLGLLLALALLTSWKTGISIFNKEIMSFLSTILILSLVILGVFSLSVFTAAIFSKKSDRIPGQSMLIRDNTLRYDGRDERGRKRKLSVDLRKIDDFLSQYSELYMVRGTRLHKQDRKGKSNADTLIVTLPDGSEMSLNALHAKDVQLYNEICAYLDRIKDKDAIDLSFRMRKYAAEEDLILSGRESCARLKDLSRQVKDKEVKRKIKETVRKIDDFEPYIIDQTDRVRKLYDHYLPMLCTICENYIVVEGHDEKIVNISDARKQLANTLSLISSAFDSLSAGKEAESFEQLEADAENLDTVMKREESKPLQK